MRKYAIFATLVAFFSVFCIDESSLSETDNALELVGENTIQEVFKTHEDSVREQNAVLYHHFFMSLAKKESRHTSNVVSRRNAGGMRSCGWVQITDIFLKQANMNRSVKEKTGTLKKPHIYYHLSDASSIDKSKEIVYWVNVKAFDEYDKNNRIYDKRLWLKVLKTHNPKAGRKYCDDVIAFYEKVP